MNTELMKAVFEALINNTSDIIFIKDEKLVYRGASKAFVEMTGKKSLDEIIGHTDSEIFDNKRLAARYIADDCRLFNGGKDLIGYIEPIADDDGNMKYGSTSKHILRNDDDKIIGILGITKDITMEYLARQRYQQEFRYLFELPKDTFAVCYIDVDDWRIICQRRQVISDRTLQECQTIEGMIAYAIESIVDENCEAVEFYRCFTAEKLYDIYSSGRRTLSFKYERKMSDGSTAWVRNKVDFLTDYDSGHLCVMLSAKDIDRYEQEQQKLAEAVKLDSMTMLFNHEATFDSIKQVLKNEGTMQHALFMIDIDNFKVLNDTLGHQAGDEFLIEFAKALRENFRESDIVGRIGGDEFFAMMRNTWDMEKIEEKAKALLETVQDIASRYLKADLSGSIGISLYPKDGKTLEELYAKSDAALYEGKRNGKNTYRFA